MSATEPREPFPHFGTAATHAGQDPDQWSFRSVVPPISLSTTFKQSVPGVPDPYEYSRSGNPTRGVFEKCVAALEGAEFGIATSSGLAAQNLLCHMLKSGDHVLCMNDLYGGTFRYFNELTTKYGVERSFVDISNLDNLRASLQDNTKMVWLESLSNPLLRYVDLEAAVEIIRGRNKDIIVVVDNTFLTPYFLRPLQLGATIVYHSVTKYLNGHSDVVMGVICTNNKQLAEKMVYLQNATGVVPSPFDCYLANRGLKTLHLRMQQHQRGALAVAHLLAASPLVEEVIYPGLPSHPQHAAISRQCTGFSGMVSFKIKGGIENVKKFFSALKVLTLAESLGGYESLVDYPTTMTHASIPKEQREAIGITENLVRCSVGLEDVQDLLDDLTQALKASQ